MNTEHTAKVMMQHVHGGTTEPPGGPDESVSVAE